MNPQFAAPSRPAVVAFAVPHDDDKTHPLSAQTRLSNSTSLASQPRRGATNAPLHHRHHSEGSSSAQASTTWQGHRHLQAPQHVRSKSIPIHPPSASSADGGEMRRSPSEQRLHEDLAMADYRDLLMFRRIAEGIRQRQRDTTHYHPRMVNDMCLASIIDTRNLTEDELAHRQRYSDNYAPSDDNYYDDDDGWALSKRGSHEPHQHRGGGVHRRDAKTTSYLDPATCKWIIAPTLHHGRHRLSVSAGEGTTAYADWVSSHSASAEDEMLFPLEL